MCFYSDLRRHLAITDVFFPTGMVLSESSDIINQKKEAPTLVHLVAMSVNKENGDLEGRMVGGMSNS